MTQFYKWNKAMARPIQCNTTMSRFPVWKHALEEVIRNPYISCLSQSETQHQTIVLSTIRLPKFQSLHKHPNLHTLTQSKTHFNYMHIFFLWLHSMDKICTICKHHHQHTYLYKISTQLQFIQENKWINV